MILPILSAFALAQGAPQAVPLHDFRDAAVWKDNKDGGNAPSVAAEAQPARGMRIRYADRSPHWGNLTGPCRVPAEATALRVRFVKHRGDGQAAMHIWLFEPDGDAWVQQVLVGARSFGALKPGPYTAVLPVGFFTFEPRGPNTREMTSADRMLIGCNYADLEVTMTSMEWQVQAAPAQAPLPRTNGLTIADGARGRIGVLDMGRSLPDGFITAHPTGRMAKALQSLGFGVTILRSGDMADSSVLDAGKLDAVVLSSGPYFPAACREAFLRFLREGGSFLATDGYAFDRLVAWDGHGWITVTQTADETDRPNSAAQPMNTRSGRPGDAMTFAPEQIGLFDPQYPLERVARVRAAPEWAGEAAPSYPMRKPVTGYAACALIGDNSPVFPPVYRRWTPILSGFDAAGEPRGALLALVRNVDGVYKGSAWAFSGLTSGQDLLLGTSARRALLGRIMDALVRRAWIHDLATESASYAPGERVRISFSATNAGRRPVRMHVTLEVAGKTVRTFDLRLQPGERRTERAEVAAPAGTLLVPVRLREMDGARAADVIETGFCVRDRSGLPKGPRIAWSGNYLTVNGRAVFMTGTNQTGMMFYSKHENPLVWDRDLRGMARHGLRILRILHFSPFAARGYEGQGGHTPLELANRPERLRRQMDAIVQLAGLHGIAVFLSLHDWQGIALTDEELAAQADWNRFWAARYRDCPWVFFDVQNEPSVDVPDRPHIVALWNAWLKERYGSDEALRDAWATRAPAATVPNVPISAMSDEWDDVRAADRKRFEAVLLNRWVKANVDGIKAGNPGAPVTVGYLPSMPPADKMLGTAHVDFSNMHYYGDVETFPLEFKLTDRRFEGKGFSVGEFGAQEAHQARNAGSDAVPVDVSVRRFRTMLHYSVSMGAAFACNWCWKEFDEAVFPWGLVQRGDGTPKPWLETFAQGSRFLAHVEPTAAQPEVFLLAPDRHRIGPRFNELHAALQRAVGLLLDCRVNFGVINEEAFDRLPASARAIVWPLPYCPDDAVFARVLAWVKGGGKLYLSGDVRFGPSRRPTRAARFAELGLPDRPIHRPFDVPPDVWDAEPLTAKVGAGGVFYVPYPLELRSTTANRAIYRRFLREAGVRAIAIATQAEGVRAQSIPLRGGGLLTMVARSGAGGEPASVRLPGPAVRFMLAPGESALVVTSSAGKATAVECPRVVEIGGRVIAESPGYFGLMAHDGLDLRASRRVTVLPYLQARVRMPNR